VGKGMEQTKVAIIINNSSYDRVYYALTIASTSAAHLKDVYVLFTYGAVQRLVKERADEIGDETDAWIRKEIELGIDKGHIGKISEMINLLKGFGGKIYACSAALAFHNLAMNDLVETVDEVTGISSFLEKTDRATMLYI
jgi:peroxiredoxin family protein